MKKTEIKSEGLKKQYVSAEAEILIVDSADIICTSWTIPGRSAEDPTMDD